MSTGQKGFMRRSFETWLMNAPDVPETTPALVEVLWRAYKRGFKLHQEMERASKKEVGREDT